MSFWNGDRPLAVLSYYATHPQSYYYTGKCSADFVGMARDQAEAAEKAGLHIHFNGAGGNIAAGKYNDGSPENRPVLAGRLAEDEAGLGRHEERSPVDDLSFDWATARRAAARWPNGTTRRSSSRCCNDDDSSN